VGATWEYLFRAVDKHGVLIDFMLSGRRNTRCTSLSSESIDNHAEPAAFLNHDG